MPRKKNLEREKKIEELLADGKLSQAEIAKETGATKGTVSKIKKRLSAQTVAAQHDAFLRKHHITLPERLQGVLTAWDYGVAAFANYEAGWLLEAEKGAELTRKQGHMWMCLYYPESVEQADEAMLKAANLGAILEYCTHDACFWQEDSKEIRVKDLIPDCDPSIAEAVVFEKGEKHKRLDPKKLHTHVLLEYEESTAYSQVLADIRRYFGTDATIPLKVNNPAFMHDYLIHDTDAAKKAGKHLYPKERRVSYNGFSVEPTKAQKESIATAIMHYVNFEMYAEWGGYEYSFLTKKYDGCPIELSVIRGNSHHLRSTIDSNRNLLLAENFEAMTDEAILAWIEREKQKTDRAIAELDLRKSHRKG